MRYRHKKGVRLALLSGHVAHVGAEWQELDDRFHQEAFKKGCEIEQNVIPEVPEPVPAASAEAVVNTDADSVIRRALVKMIERSEAGDFSSTGLPSIKAVAKIAGTPVAKGDVYRVYRQMKAEAEAEAAAQGAGQAE